MALSAFDDKTKKPGKRELRTTLGRSVLHWDRLLSHAVEEYAPLEETWSFAGASWGWSLRLRRKKRTILYLTPCEKHFLVGFALGEKAVRAARDAALPGAVVARIEGAKKYAEGRAVRLQVRTGKDLKVVKKLAAIKMAS